MFNVCAGCGEYTDEKVVGFDGPRGSHNLSSAATVATCPTCGFAIEFLSLPLFVVIGASGAGKTTAALAMAKASHDFVVLDQDILWNDSFNAPENNYRQFRNTWLRMVKNIHQAGRSVVLFGSAIPEQYETCAERRYLGYIHYVALVCESSELERRLRARPQWRKSGTEENVREMVSFNTWLEKNASKTAPPMSVIDTTRLSVSQTAEAILSWTRLVGASPE